MPTTTETRTVWNANSLALGEVDAHRAEQHDHGLCDAEPEDEPDRGGDQPDHEAFEPDRAHDLLARGAERPQCRELTCALSDRDRQRVEDHERTDEQRDGSEAEQEVADLGNSLVGLRGRLLGRLRCPWPQRGRDDRPHGIDQFRS